MSQSTQHIASFDRAYFIGIGGIGMSALARYFNMKGWDVAGYDKTPSPITKALEEEGVSSSFRGLGRSVAQQFLDTEKTLVVLYSCNSKRNEGVGVCSEWRLYSKKACRSPWNDYARLKSAWALREHMGRRLRAQCSRIY